MLYILLKVPGDACQGGSYQFEVGVKCDTFLCGPNIDGPSTVYDYMVQCDDPDDSDCGMCEDWHSKARFSDVVDFFMGYLTAMYIVAVVFTVLLLVT